MAIYKNLILWLLTKAGREFLSPSPPFLPAPPERFWMSQNAAGVLLKMGSRYFQNIPQKETSESNRTKWRGGGAAAPFRFCTVGPMVIIIKRSI